MKDIGITNYCSEPCLGRAKESNNQGKKKAGQENI